MYKVSVKMIENLHVKLFTLLDVSFTLQNHITAKQMDSAGGC